MSTIADNIGDQLLVRHSHGSSSMPSAGFMIGQKLNIRVQRKLDEQHYLVLIRGTPRQVTSIGMLPVGKEVSTVVVGNVDKLTLRQTIDSPEIASNNSHVVSLSDQLYLSDSKALQEQLKFYKCSLTKKDISTIERAVQSVGDHCQKMVMAGLLLSKRGMEITNSGMKKLYELQMGFRSDPVKVDELATEPTVNTMGQIMRLTIESEITEPKVGSVPKAMAELIGEEQAILSGMELLPGNHRDATMPRSSAGNDFAQQDGRQLQSLFNLLNDVDANGEGIRYGTIPLLINGRLVELELVSMQQRRPEANMSDIRRLVMSINTEKLGTVVVTAEALHNRVNIKVSTEEAHAISELSRFSAEVKDLVQRFGWQPDLLQYELQPTKQTLASRLVERAVGQGVVDHVW